jgi:cellulose synthase/poly-beta-1,6-N-acetylglucosamine synthase-like glycosyltransferase
MIAAVLAVAGLAAGAWTIAVYPLLLRVWPFRRAATVLKDPQWRATVSVVMAVYNGAHFLRAKLESILSLDYPRELMEVLVVSDGSTDQSNAIAGEYAGRGVKLIVVPRGGKAAALNAAFEHAGGEILFFTDVRQPLDRAALRELVANFADPTVGAVTGELRLLPGEAGEQADMDMYWRYEVWARKRHSEIDSLFNTTGCIYAMRRSLAGPIPADTLTDDAILPLRAFFRGYRVIFEPAAIAYDYPAVPGTEFRRRFRTLAGLWQVHARVPELSGSGNRMRFHFFSHKSSRLLLPWAILLVIAMAPLLPTAPARVLLLAAGLWLGLVALDFIVPRGFPLKRLTSPARTFFVMNAAAAAAIGVFFLPAERLWKPTRVMTEVRQ